MYTKITHNFRFYHQAKTKSKNFFTHKIKPKVPLPWRHVVQKCKSCMLCKNCMLRESARTACCTKVQELHVNCRFHKSKELHIARKCKNCLWTACFTKVKNCTLHKSARTACELHVSQKCKHCIWTACCTKVKNCTLHKSPRTAFLHKNASTTCCAKMQELPVVQKCKNCLKK